MVAEHEHMNDFVHLALDLSATMPRHEYDLGEKAGGANKEDGTYLLHYISVGARDGDRILLDGSFAYALGRDFWAEMLKPDSADRDLLQRLAHAAVAEDLAAIDSGGDPPAWFKPFHAAGEVSPKFLRP